MSDPKDFVIKNGVLTQYKGSGGDVVIPDDVVEIGEKAFQGKGIESITVPGTVKEIGPEAFEYCRLLKDVKLSEGLETIGENSFVASGIEKIILPESVKVIGRNAFDDCDELTEVVLPEGDVEIGEGAFEYCRGLADETGFVIVNNILFDYFGNDSVIHVPDHVKYICNKTMGWGTRTMIVRGVEIPFDYSAKRIDKKYIPNVQEIYPLLSDSILIGSIINKSVWKKLSPELQAEIFLARQSKELLKVYFKCIDSEKCHAFAESILSRLNSENSSDALIAVAEFMRNYYADIPEETLLNMYDGIRSSDNGEKACEVIEHSAVLAAIIQKQKDAILQKGGKKADKAIKIAADDPQLMCKLSREAAVSAMTKEEETVAAWLTENKMTIAAMEQRFREGYGIAFKDLPAVKKKDGIPLATNVFAWLLMIHEKLVKETRSKPYVSIEYNTPGVDPAAGEIISLLDGDSLQSALITLADNYLGKAGWTQKMFLARPICRYADEKTMAELTKRAPKWRSSVSGDDAPPFRIFKTSSRYSNTRAAMMFAEKYHDLDAYAELRGTDAQTLRDEFMSDVGLDENGRKTYDLGNTVVELSLADDLSLNLYDINAQKPVKSIPKKGADPEKYEMAKADYADLKKNVRKLVKMRADMLFEAFLDARPINAEHWQKVYMKNPLLNHVAELVVWEQDGKTLTLKDKTPIDSTESRVELTGNPIRVAHPMEMNQKDLEQWQKYFIMHGLKQPFEQVWEPVRDKNDIDSGRYAGNTMPLWRFVGKDKHGIIATGFHAYSEGYSIDFTDCDLELKNLDRRLDGYASRDKNVKLGSFTFPEFTRYTNHIVALLDRWTIADRVRKDDVSIADLLPGQTLAQITEFIKAAGENNCNNVMAVLLDYKDKNFGGYDPMDEFTLDL